jgi:hypothetical protein
MSQIVSIQTQPYENIFNYSLARKEVREPPKISELVKKVALSTFKESIVTAAVTAISLPFVATPLGGAVIIGSAIFLLGIKTCMQGIEAYWVYQGSQEKDHHAIAACHTMEKFVFLQSSVPFSLFSNATVAVLAHESGHALAAKALFRQSDPQIVLNFPNGGWTSYEDWHGLTKWGECFGRARSNLLVTAAGPAFGVVTSIISLGIAHMIQRDHPRASLYLNALAVMNIFTHVIYALSALVPSEQTIGHDFVALAASGIHPLAAAVVMVAIPILFKAALYASDQIFDRLRR